MRARGLMAAFDVEGAPELVKKLLTEQRLVANATGPVTVRLLPPLTVTPEEIDDALERLARVVGSGA